METICPSSGRKLIFGTPALALLNLLVLAMSLPCTLNAAILSWSGGGSDSYWNNSANWGYIGTPINGDTLIFSSGQPRMNNTNNISGLTLNEIRFVGGDGGYALQGNSLILTNDIVATNSIGTNYINNDIAFAGGDIPVAVGLSSSGFPTKLNLAGVVSGSVGIVKTGAGNLALSGSNPNTYTGQTTVQQGTLELNKSSGPAIPSGTLSLGGTNDSDQPHVIEMADNQIGSKDIIFSGSGGAFGMLDLNGHTDSFGTNFVFSATGNGIVTMGGGTLAVGGSNCWISGGAKFYDGTFALGASACTAAEEAPDTIVTLQCNITGTSSSSITGIGPTSSYLDFQGTNTYSGTITANGLQITANSPTALGSTNGLTIVTNGGVLELSDQCFTNETLVLNGSGWIGLGALWGGTNTWAGPIILGSDTTIGNLNELTIRGPISGTANLTLGKTNTFGTASDIFIFTGSSANTYNGNTSLQPGCTLKLNKSSGDAIPYGSLIIGSNAVVREMTDNQVGKISISVGELGVFDLNGFNDAIGTNINFEGDFIGGHVKLGGGTLTMSGPNPVIFATNSSGQIGDFDTLGFLALGTNACTIAGGRTIALNCSISGSLASSITVTGGGSVSLGESNSFAGPLFIDQGTVTVGNPFALGSTSGSTIVSNGAILYLSANVTNETLVLNGEPGTRGALQAWTFDTNVWAGPLVLGSDSSIDALAGLRIIGPISGTANLKIGVNNGIPFDSTIFFEGSAANFYSGSTYVYENLVLSKSVVNSTIGGPLIIGDGKNASSVTLAFNAQIPDSDPVTVNSNAVFNLNNISETFGALSGSGSVVLGTGTLGPNADDGNSTFSGIISGTGAVKKLGSGTLTLTGNNTFTGTNEIVLGTEIVDDYQPQAPVLVDLPGKLAGTGTVGSVICSGRLAPGDSGIGTLTTSNLTFTSSGAMVVELGAPTNSDQVRVRGTVTLAGANLQVIPMFTTAAVVGQTFNIIANDGTDPVTGTFNALPEGATVNGGVYNFKISYVGSGGNDVVLTLIGVPGAVASSALTGGNGNHAIDPNECGDLTIVLTNTTGVAMTGVTGTLYTTTMNVMVTQPQSPYADIPALGRGTNTTAFGISTLPGFSCGTNINLVLQVATTSYGTFDIPFLLHTGEPAGGAMRFDNFTPLSIPDGGFVDSTNNAGGFTGPLEKVAVMLDISHPRDSDLNISLVSPDGISVTLAAALGGAGANYGTNCSPDTARTTFDDSAPDSINTAAVPFAGVFRPQNSFAAFNYGTANGPWHLHVADTAFGSIGSLNCWSLLLYPVSCSGSGGYCGTCPSPINSSITGGDPTITGRILPNSVASSCLTAKAYPGAAGGTYHYDAYYFTNSTGADDCISVGLISPSDVAACAYLPAFNPADVSANYLADAGDSTTSAGGSTSFSFECPAGATFIVTVTETASGAGAPNYTLLVNGLACPPPLLTIAPVATNSVRVDWPTYAAGYKLAATPALSPTNWTEVPNEPVVNSGRFAVTNNSAIGNRFYRLRSP